MLVSMKVSDLEKARATYNPRVMPEAEAAALQTSIARFGELQPIVFNKRTKTIVGGHQRVSARAAMKRKTALVMVVDLDENDEKAANLALNKIHGDWDFPKLQQLLDELGSINSDLPAIAGFTEQELRSIEQSGNLLGLRISDARKSQQEIDAAANEVDQDEIPLPPDAPTTRRGDIWQLGDHRLMCGDSSVEADLDLLLDGAIVHLANIDPPYNVKMEPRSNNAIASSMRGAKTSHHQKLDVMRHPSKSKGTTKQMRAKDRALVNDFISDGDFENLLARWFANFARVLKPGRAFYLWGGYSNISNYPQAMKAAGLFFSQALIWVKGHPVLTRKDFLGDHEWCFYGWREGAAHQFFGPNNIADVWVVKKLPPQKMIHLCERPVDLYARAIMYSSKKGENVLDMFGGSGCTIIACEHLGRHGFSLEIDPAYCDVILARWQALTGNFATLVASTDGASINPKHPHGPTITAVRDWREMKAARGLADATKALAAGATVIGPTGAAGGGAPHPPRSGRSSSRRAASL
jgi:DNA modification methylase